MLEQCCYGSLGRTWPCCPGCPVFCHLWHLQDVGLELGAASRSPPSCYGVRERGCSQQGPGTPAASSTAASPAPLCAHRLRCLGDGNSHTLLFILKDTFSSVVAKPSKDRMAWHTKSQRGNRALSSRPAATSWGRASPWGAQEDARGVTAPRWHCSKPD